MAQRLDVGHGVHDVLGGVVERVGGVAGQRVVQGAGQVVNAGGGVGDGADEVGEFLRHRADLRLVGLWPLLAGQGQHRVVRPLPVRIGGDRQITHRVLPPRAVLIDGVAIPSPAPVCCRHVAAPATAGGGSVVDRTSRSAGCRPRGWLGESATKIDPNGRAEGAAVGINDALPLAPPRRAPGSHAGVTAPQESAPEPSAAHFMTARRPGRFASLGAGFLVGLVLA